MGFFGFGGKRAKRNKKRSAPRRLSLSVRGLHFEPLEQRQLLTVTVNPITGPDPNSAYNTPSGKDLYVPLVGSDTGNTITYSATSSNPNVQVSVLTGNPELIMNVTGTDSTGASFSGQLVFQLFENLAPQTVAAIIANVNNGVYTNSSFYRMETSSSFQLIQGGISEESNPPSVATVPNEYNANIAFNSPGLLAMAATSAHVASSEFFLTGPTQPLSAEPQALNFGYTIFGQLLKGQDIYNKILNVQTHSSSGVNIANTPVTITSASIVQNDTQNGVLQISEAPGFTGNATITVTGAGSDSTSAQQTFNVNVIAPAPPTQEPQVLLGAVSNLTTQAGKAITFQITASDTNGGTATFNIGDQNPFGQAPYATPANVTVTIAPGTGNTATVTLTPKAGFTGTLNLVAHADDSSSGLRDAQDFTLTVAGPITVQTDGTTQQVTAGSSLGVTGLSITDPGLSTTSNVTATFAVAHGTINFSTSTTAGITSSQVTGNGTGSVTITAPLAAINATLAATSGITYTPSASFGGSDSLSITASDSAGNTNTNSVSLAVLSSILINVPSSSLATAMGAGLAIAGLSISDPALPAANNVAFTFKPQSGTITLATNIPNGITSAEVTGNGTGTVSVNATQAQINATLADANGVTYAPTSSFSGTDTVQLHASDGSNSTDNDFTVTVGLSITAPTTIKAPSGTNFAITGVSITDAALPSTDTITLTIAATHGTIKVGSTITGGVSSSGITGNNTATVTIAGTLAQVNATLAGTGGLLYRSANDYDGPDTITITANDQLTSSGTSTVGVSVIGPLSINGPTNGLVQANTVQHITGVSLDDTGLPATDNVTLTFAVQNGIINLSTAVTAGLTAAQITTNGTGSVTIIAPLAAINATLADANGLTYTPHTGFSGDDTVAITASDTAANSPSTSISYVVIGPITLTTPQTQTAISGGSASISGISLSDPGLSSQSAVTMTFSVAHGSLTFSTAVSLGLVDGQISGNGTSSVTITAPVNAINNTLANASGLTYVSTASFNGSDAIAMTVSDPADNTATGSASIAVGLAVNAPASQLGTASTALALTGVSITDPALSASGTVTVNLTATNGNILLSTAVSGGLTTSQVTGNGTGTVTVTGTLAAINATLAAANGLTYTSTAGGADTVTFAASDTLESQASASTAVTIVGPLSITAPTSQTLTTGSSVAITGATLADPSLPTTSNVTVTLTTTLGTVALSTSISGGLTASQITGNGTGSVTITAPLAAINATLAAANGLTYAGTTAGADTLKIQAHDDAGNTATPTNTPLSVFGPVTINVPSTPPTLKTNGSVAITSISVTDPGLSSTDNVTLVLNAGHGTLTLSTSITSGLTAGQITGNGTSNVTITAPLAAINATLAAAAGLTYAPTTGFNGTDTIGLSANDTHNNSNTASFSATAIGPVTVTVPSGTSTIGSSANSSITGISLTDSSLPSTSNVTVNLSAAHGTLTLLTNVTGGLTAAQISGNGTSNLTITAPLAAINATLAAANGLVYKAISGFAGSDSVSLTATDPVSNTNTASVSLAVVGPLSVTIPATPTVKLNTPLAITGLSVADPSLPTTSNVTLTLAVTHGVITLSTTVTNGLTSSQITGNGTASVTITGPLAAIVATLAAATGLTYTPTTGFSGSDALSISGSDPFSNTATQSLTLTVLGASNSSISGMVYLDGNLNGQLDASESGLGGVILILQGTDSQNNAIGPLAIKTASNGSFQFNSLPAGTYTLTKIAPADLVDGAATVGSLSGTLQGKDVISSITIAAGAAGTGYNFAEDALDPHFVTLDMFLNTSPTPVQTLVNYIAKSYADAGVSTTAPVGISGQVPAPVVNVVTAAFNLNQAGSKVVTGLSVSDSALSSSSSNVTVTLSVASGTLAVSTTVSGGVTTSQVTGSGTTTVTITAPLSAINAMLADPNGLTYTPTSTFNGNDTLGVTVNDLGNTTTGTQQTGNASVALHVIAAPVITSASSSAIVPTGSTSNVTGLSIADSALTNASGNVQLNLAAAHGTINLSTSVSGGITAAQITNNGTANVTINAPLAAINATLAATAGVTFTPTSGFTGTDTLGITLSDLANTASGVAQTTTKTVPVSIVGPLAITAPSGTQSAASGSAVITGVSIADPALPSTSNVTLTLTASNGTVALSTAISGGITSTQVTGNGTASVTITAPLAAINATLAGASGLTYTANSGFTGTDTLGLSSTDVAGNHGTATVTVSATAKLSIAAPSTSQSVGINTPKVITGVTIADPALTSTGTVTLTLTATHGTVALSTSVTGGVTTSQVTNNSSGSVTVTASLAAINATLADAAGLTYTPTSGFVGGDTLALSASDTLSTSATASVSITVAGPLSSTLGTNAQSVAVNSPLVLSGIAYADPSLPTTSNVTVVVSAAHGTVTLSTTVTNGLTTSQITGNGTGSVTITAPLAAISATLTAANGATYTPTSGFAGTDTVAFAANDTFGNTNTASITVTVAGPLAITAPSDTQSVAVNGSKVVSGVLLADPSFPATGNVTVNLTATHGTVTLSTAVTGGITTAQVTGNGTGAVTIIAPLAAINATLADAAGLTYAPTSGYSGADSIGLTATDSLSNTNTATITINVTGALSIAAPSDTQLVAINSTKAVSGIVVSDPSLSSSGTVTLVLTATNGTILLSTTVSGGITASQVTGTTNGTGSVIITAPLAAINTTLAAISGLTYKPNTGYVGDDTLALSATDSLSNSSGTTNVAIQVAGPLSMTVPTDELVVPQGGSLVVSGISLSDPSLPATSNVTLTLNVNNGTVALSTAVTGGLTADQISNNGSGFVTVTAPLAAISATLGDPAGLTYTANADFTGPDTLVLTGTDLFGNTISKNVALNVVAPLSITAPTDTQLLAINGSKVISGVSLTDPTLPAASDVTLTLTATNGIVNLSTAVTSGLTAGQITGNGTGSVSITAPLAAINATLADANGLTYAANHGFAGADTLVFTATDSLSHNVTTNVTLAIAGPVAINAPSNTLSVTTNVAQVLSGISLADPSLPATSNVTLTLGVTNGTIALSTAVNGGLTAAQVSTNGTGSVTITAPLAAINATLHDANGLTYTPNTEFGGADALSLTATDVVGNATTASVAMIVADPLAIKVPVDTQTLAANSSKVISDVVLGDPSLQSGNVTLKLTVTNGKLDLSTTVTNGLTAGQVTDNGSGTVTITAPVAAINATLADPAGLTYTPTTGYAGPDTLALNGTDALAHDVTVDVALAVVGPVSLSAPADTLSAPAVGSKGISNIVLGDPNLPATSPVTLTFATTNGTISVSTAVNGGITAGQIIGNGTGNITITAPLAAITATLADANGVSYTANEGFTGSDTVALTADDTIGVQATANVSVAVFGSLSILAPSDTQVLTINGSKVISGVVIADPGIPAMSDVTLTLTATSGTLNLSTSVSGGLTASQITGNGSDSVTIMAPLDAISATLADAAGLTYKPVDAFSGNDTIVLSVADLAGNAPSPVNVATLVAGPLFIATPAAQTVGENSSLAITNIVLTDPSLPDATNVTFTLSVTNGIVSLSTGISSGITATQVTGNGTGTVTVTAPLAAINATLADAEGLTYTPNSGYSGSDSLALLVNDSLVSSSVTSSVAITVAAPIS
ncbi:MAG TPA: peptidylprolyl isomerase [Pirellulales bacterium]|jgi:cyclophilin family peptidyl-prolyl cis-trans isomerase